MIKHNFKKVKEDNNLKMKRIYRSDRKKTGLLSACSWQGKFPDVLLSDFDAKKYQWRYSVEAVAPGIQLELQHRVKRMRQMGRQRTPPHARAPLRIGHSINTVRGCAGAAQIHRCCVVD
jgi:hypothetical protein